MHPRQSRLVVSADVVRRRSSAPPSLQCASVSPVKSSRARGDRRGSRRLGTTVLLPLSGHSTPAPGIDDHAARLPPCRCLRTGHIRVPPHLPATQSAGRWCESVSGDAHVHVAGDVSRETPAPASVGALAMATVPRVGMARWSHREQRTEASRPEYLERECGAKRCSRQVPDPAALGCATRWVGDSTRGLDVAPSIARPCRCTETWWPMSTSWTSCRLALYQHGGVSRQDGPTSGGRCPSAVSRGTTCQRCRTRRSARFHVKQAHHDDGVPTAPPCLPITARLLVGRGRRFPVA